MRAHIKKGETYDPEKPAEVALDELRYRIALEKARNLRLPHPTNVEKSQMIEINDDFTIIEDIEKFPLGSN